LVTSTGPTNRSAASVEGVDDILRFCRERLQSCGTRRNHSRSQLSWGMTSGRQPRRDGAALAEIRAAEAARVLGLQDPMTLPGLAQGWLRDGLDSPSLRALAGAATSGANPTGQVLLELLATIAHEQGISFGTLQAARTVHAQSVVSLISEAGEFGPQLFGLSNTVTDEFAARIGAFFRRLRRNPDRPS